jgi:hypothetical protein
VSELFGTKVVFDPSDLLFDGSACDVNDAGLSTINCGCTMFSLRAMPFVSDPFEGGGSLSGAAF